MGNAASVHIRILLNARLVVTHPPTHTTMNRVANDATLARARESDTAADTAASHLRLLRALFVFDFLVLCL